MKLLSLFMIPGYLCGLVLVIAGICQIRRREW